VHEFPNVPDYSNLMGVVLNSMAGGLRKQGRRDEALPVREQSIQFYRRAARQSPKANTYRRNLAERLYEFAEVLVADQDHERAYAIVTELVAVDGQGPKHTLDAARLIARCAALVEEDDKLSAADRESFAKTYRDESIALLRRAQRDGLATRQEIESVPELLALVKRNGYDDLLTTLQGPSKEPSNQADSAIASPAGIGQESAEANWSFENSDYPPVLESNVNSVKSTRETTLEFQNRTSTHLRLWWRTIEGQRQPYGELAPGSVRVQQTFVDHVWVVTDRTDRALGIYRAEDAERSVVLSVP
jgi:hypothetical protein